MAQTVKQPTRHILDLTPQEQEAFLDSFDLVLFDCDGVLWLVCNPIPHTGEAINLLKNAGKQCKFISNNSLRSDDEYMQKFRKIGVKDVQKSEVVHTAKAMAQYLQKHKPGERVFSIASLEANEVMRHSDILVETMTTAEHLTPKLLTTISADEESKSQKVGAVVFDINFDLNYGQLMMAHQYLKQEDCILLTGGADTLFPLTADLIIPGFSEFYNYLSHYSNKPAITLAKPSVELGEIVKDMFNINTPKSCLLIGDSLEQDIQFGRDCGFQTLLVLTGAYTKEHMLAAEGVIRPDYYAHSLADFRAFFKSIKAANPY